MESIEDIKPIIRKITIGDMKEGLTYVVGQTMMRGQLEVTAIVIFLMIGFISSSNSMMMSML